MSDLLINALLMVVGGLIGFGIATEFYSRELRKLYEFYERELQKFYDRLKD